MRPYKEKDNVQAKAYYTDRFWVAPQLPKDDVEGDEVFKADLEVLKSKFEIKEAYIQKGQMVVFIDPKDNRDVLKTLKNELKYDFLSELSAVDFLARGGYFEVFYQMLSIEKVKRLRIKCRLGDGEAINTIEDIFKAADWAEREMYDMFGIKANGHPYLKRILMPDDWSGHPLLKSYPLQGDEAAQWYEIDKIFGKEYREVVGPENRDPGFVDPNDTRNFSHIRHEVGYGEAPSNVPTNNDYQEEGGVILVEKMKKENSKVLEERR